MTNVPNNDSDICRILVVGQTPPPYHGQGIMVERLVNASMDNVRVHHVRMAFSKSMDEVGRPGIGKVFHLFQVICQIVYQRLAHRIQVLYYPPAGPNRVPMWRDIVILTCTRWMFPRIVFHMQASGISELYSQLGVVGRWLYRRAYFGADAVIRLSELTVNDAQTLEAKRQFIIPNCADDELARFESQRQSRLQHNDETLRLMYLGTVCRSKGILVLIDACNELLDEGVRFTLDVVGSFQPADFEHTVRTAIKQAGLANHVRLCGQITGDEKFAKLASSDVFCFPTFYESEAFPCVLVEAMSFGLPVVSTHWRGIRSIVDDGKNGFLTDTEDSRALVVAIRKLASDRALLHAMGRAGREKFEQHYTAERHIQLMEAALTAVGKNGSIRTVHETEPGIRREIA